ncbi:SH3 domain-containing protein [Paramuribaculum intestinale]|uniref:SH3 domain-containing protein n=1 Tax=Paramuribaculum intestinale TaxID=2094151 RepID=UPI00272FEB8F|nr:hypothetical protein [Paramuribaculum intestinale]
MKQLLIIITILTCVNLATAKDMIGVTTTAINFREGPSTDSDVIKVLPFASVLVYNDTNEENGFYYGYLVKDGIWGYFASKYITPVEEVPVHENSLEEIKTEDVLLDDALVEVWNDTDRNMTLYVNKLSYAFKPQERMTIKLPDGDIRIRATAKGVIPYITDESILGGRQYSWQFYIVTSKIKPIGR